MRYTPSTLVTDPAIASELLQISRVIEDLDSRIITKFHEEPEKLRDGMLAYADGTDWNPGSGEGFYGYYAAAWHFLG